MSSGIDKHGLVNYHEKMRGRHSEETKKKISVANTAELSSQWKGIGAKYQALHMWIRRHYGKAVKCENFFCEGISHQYQWALKLGKKYSRNIEDYIQLCRSCHRKMDMTPETKQKIIENHGTRIHWFCTVDGCKKKHLAKGYCSHHYNTIYRKI